MENRICLLCVTTLMACAPTRAPVATGVAGFVRADRLRSQSDGKLMLDEVLPGLHAAAHYRLAGQLLTPDAHLILMSHFNGFEWRDGVQLQVRRGSGPRDILVAVNTPGFPPQTATVADALLSEQGDFRLRVEVHNGTAGGCRVIVWRDFVSYQDQVPHPKSPLYAGNAEFDTQRAGWVFQSFGRGTRLGVELHQVHLLTLSREAPYVH